MSSPLTLSIVTANYNNSLYLDDFFRSINESTCLPDEVIFVDDASVDNSLEIVDKWKQKVSFNIIVIALKENVGFANALNIGIGHAKSDLILRIDPDDFMHCNRIKTEQDFLTANTNYDVVGSNTFYYNSRRNTVVGRSYFPASNASINNGIRKGIITLSNGSFSARRQILLQCRYSQEFLGYEEYALFAKMVWHGVRIVNLSVALTYYRVRNQNRGLRYLLSVQKGISQVCESYFKYKTANFVLFFRAFSGFLYWRALNASNIFIQLTYLLLVLPIKVFSIKRFINS